MKAELEKKLERMVPPGYPVKTERLFWRNGMVLAFLWSFGYFVRLNNAAAKLHQFIPPDEKVLIPGAIMPCFTDVLGSALVPFALLALCMLGFAVSHYAYHWQGAKSVYLMRRLPDRNLWHKRCLTLPVLLALAALLAAAVLMVLYFIVYLVCTPAACRLPGGLMKLFFGGL